MKSGDTFPALLVMDCTGSIRQRWSTYQQKFIDAISMKAATKNRVDAEKLKKLLVDLIKATHRKMRGYQVDSTIRYYNNMMKKAWDKIKNLPEDIEWEDIEKEYEWLILDEDFKRKSEKYLGDRYYLHRPYYYNRYYYYDNNKKYHYNKFKLTFLIIFFLLLFFLSPSE